MFLYFSYFYLLEAFTMVFIHFFINEALIWMVMHLFCTQEKLAYAFL